MLFLFFPCQSTGEAKGVAASCHDDYSCLATRLSEMERQALEAIRTLHGQLDDDANGNIDVTESDEVLTFRTS